MGLAIMPYFNSILWSRAYQWKRYQGSLEGSALQLATVPDDTVYNHAYFPVVFQSEGRLHQAISDLNAEGIFPRRYFYPSITEVPYVDQIGACPVAESIARRVICLPLFHELDDALIDRIARIVQEAARTS